MLDEVLAYLDRAVDEITQLEACASSTRAELTAARDVLAVPTESWAPSEPDSPALSPPAVTDITDAKEPVSEVDPIDPHVPEITPPTTASGLGVTDVVRSAVQKAVAQRSNRRHRLIAAARTSARHHAAALTPRSGPTP